MVGIRTYNNTSLSQTSTNCAVPHGRLPTPVSQWVSQWVSAVIRSFRLEIASPSFASLFWVTLYPVLLFCNTGHQTLDPLWCEFVSPLDRLTQFSFQSLCTDNIDKANEHTSSVSHFWSSWSLKLIKVNEVGETVLLCDFFKAINI